MAALNKKPELSGVATQRRACRGLIHGAAKDATSGRLFFGYFLQRNKRKHLGRGTNSRSKSTRVSARNRHHAAHCTLSAPYGPGKYTPIGAWPRSASRTKQNRPKPGLFCLSALNLTPNPYSGNTFPTSCRSKPIMLGILRSGAITIMRVTFRSRRICAPMP